MSTPFVNKQILFYCAFLFRENVIIRSELGRGEGEPKVKRLLILFWTYFTLPFYYLLNFETISSFRLSNLSLM